MGVAQDRYTPRIDQGHRHFKFWLDGGKVKKSLERIDRRALAKNEEPFALSFFPSGAGSKPKPLAVLSDGAVQIAAIKRAEKNNDIIVRLFEPTGKSRSAVLTLGFVRRKIKIDLDGFEIRTIRVNPKTGKYRKVNLVERNL